MADPVILQEWIGKAEDDFQFARISLSEKKPFYAHICFLYQQSAEKYLKAFTLTQGLKFQKTHDLAALLQKCIAKAPAIESLADDCDLLATFYVETRYPVHCPPRLHRMTPNWRTAQPTAFETSSVENLCCLD